MSEWILESERPRFNPGFLCYKKTGGVVVQLLLGTIAKGNNSIDFGVREIWLEMLTPPMTYLFNFVQVT